MPNLIGSPTITADHGCVVSLGHIIAAASVVGISGGWTSITLARYFHVHIAWQWFTVPFTPAAFALCVKAVLAYVAGFTSITGALISASNSQSRLIFNAGREGLLPRAVAASRPDPARRG